MTRFKPTSTYYRCLCEETSEEQIFSTEKQATAWSQKVVDTFGQQMTFCLTRVHEAARRYSRDRFERENYIECVAIRSAVNKPARS